MTTLTCGWCSGLIRGGVGRGSGFDFSFDHSLSLSLKGGKQAIARGAVATPKSNHVSICCKFL